MVCEGVDHLSLAELASRFPSGQRPSSIDMGLIRSEVSKRYHLLGELYPYRADEDGIERCAGTTSLIYDFLAVLSAEAAPYRRERRFNEANRLFDFLVREAVKAQFGSGSDGVRFGTPVQDGRPDAFSEAIKWLADRMGVATGIADLPVDANDHGVDVIAWKPFASGRSGFPVVLVQSSLQLDFVEKASQIPVHAWTRFLDIGPTPMTALSIPFSIRDGDDRWMITSLVVGQILNRIRICELLADVDLVQFSELADIRVFVDSEVRAWNAAIEEPDTPAPRVLKPRRQGASEHRDALRR